MYIEKIKKFFLTYALPLPTILTAYILITVIASSLLILQGEKTLGDYHYTHYNNYIIFNQSFHHLIQQKDLYEAYPKEHWDYYKYSPTFSLFMGALAYFPNLISLIAWNLLNALVLFFAIKNLPRIADRNKSYMLWFILPELIINMQNSQSNGLTAGLMLWTFIYLEKQKSFTAVLVACSALFIKIFGGFAALIFIFYPAKIKFLAYALLCSIGLALLPLLVIPPEQLFILYTSWFHLLGSDHEASIGLSVMGWLQTWFGLYADKNIVLIIGAAIMLIPILKTIYLKLITSNLKLLYLSALMVWVVIFNHKAESPTFIIAITGTALWYFTQPRSWVKTTLVIVAFIFSSLSPTDIFPAFIRKQYVVPYVLKAVPLMLIWIKIIYDLTIKTRKNDLGQIV